MQKCADFAHYIQPSFIFFDSEKHEIKKNIIPAKAPE
jgi:hypothetical protein